LVKKSVRNKAISSVLGTVIVLAITIALGGLLYAYSQGMFSNLTQNTNINVQAKIIVNPSTNDSYLQLTLVNNGNLGINITKVTIDSNGISIPINVYLPPGQQYSNTFPLTSKMIAGETYTVTVYGNSNNKPVVETMNVLASTV